jgi:hypothetical protein
MTVVITTFDLGSSVVASENGNDGTGGRCALGSFK